VSIGCSITPIHLTMSLVLGFSLLVFGVCYALASVLSDVSVSKYDEEYL